jgi:hypothetical protein
VFKLSWANRAEVSFSGKFLKFKDGTEYIVKFLKDPTERNFSLGGQEKLSYEFPVSIDGVGKTLSVTSKRLMNKLISEDKKAPLVGRTLRIRALGDGTARDWMVEAV